MWALLFRLGYPLKERKACSARLVLVSFTASSNMSLSFSVKASSALRSGQRRQVYRGDDHLIQNRATAIQRYITWRNTHRRDPKLLREQMKVKVI